MYQKWNLAVSTTYLIPPQTEIQTWSKYLQSVEKIQWALQEELVAQSIQYQPLLYEWRESCLLIDPIYLDKSLCQPENRIKLVYSGG